MAEKDTETPPGAPEQDNGSEPSASHLVVKLADVEDRLLRCLAEQENIRKFARREREEVVRYAAAGFAADLLASIDDLERAIASVAEEQRSDPVVAGLLAGIEATRRALLDTLSKHGLKRLDPLGEPFDPHRQEACFEADDTSYPPGIVASVVRPGYMYRDRLLRPALVGVSKAGVPS